MTKVARIKIDVKYNLKGKKKQVPPLLCLTTASVRPEGVAGEEGGHWVSSHLSSLVPSQNIPTDYSISISVSVVMPASQHPCLKIDAP